MVDPTTTTKLQAVNAILASLNEAPVSSLGSSATYLAQHSEDMLDRVNKEVQSEGWEFNLEFDVTLSPSAGIINAPGNAAWVHIPNKFNTGNTPEGFARYTLRNGRIYDRQEKSDTGHTADLKASICYMLEFVKLPESAKRYIILRSSRMLGDQVRPNPQRHSTMLRDELTAKSALYELEGRMESFTIFDNFDAFQAIDRGNPVTRGPRW